MKMKFEMLPDNEQQRIRDELTALNNKFNTLMNDYLNHSLQAANMKVRLESIQRKANKIKEEFGII